MFDLVTRRAWLGAAAVAALPGGAAAAPDASPPWPQANGPTGNFNPLRSGARLVDDLRDARQSWLSDFHDLGFAKGSSSGYLNHLADSATHPGSASGLIVAEGKVFASSFRPRGDVWAERAPVVLGGIDSFTGDRLAALRRNTAIDADDLTVALDFATGATAWTAVEEGKGLNRYSGKRLQFHGTPVYHAGRVFSLGTTGRVYAYAAATGRKLWEDDTGSLVRPAAALKEKLLAGRNALPGGEGMGASPVVAGGGARGPAVRHAGARRRPSGARPRHRPHPVGSPRLHQPVRHARGVDARRQAVRPRRHGEGRAAAH